MEGMEASFQALTLWDGSPCHGDAHHASPPAGAGAGGPERTPPHAGTVTVSTAHPGTARCLQTRAGERLRAPVALLTPRFPPFLPPTPRGDYTVSGVIQAL